MLLLLVLFVVLVRGAQGHKEVISSLLRCAGATPDGPGLAGMPLKNALLQNNVKVVEMLLAAGASVQALVCTRIESLRCMQVPRF